MSTESMSSEQLIEHIRGLLADRSGLAVDQIDTDENLLTSGMVDSIGMMRLINDLEDLLCVEIPATDLLPENFQTIAVMSRYLTGLR